MTPPESNFPQTDDGPVTHPETILVIEDGEALRDLVCELLGGLGYKAVAVADGPSALDLVAGGLQFNLLFTDIRLPRGMNGHELAEKISAMRPGVKILYTSGYSGKTVPDGLLSGDAPFLSKPYRRATLAAAVRKALARRGN